MRTSTRLVTAFIGFMLMPLVILFALPTMENPEEMAVVALAGVALYLFMFVTFRRSGPKAQHSARLLARMTFPGDPTTPQQVESLMRHGAWCFVVGAVLLMFVAGRYFFFMA